VTLSSGRSTTIIRGGNTGQRHSPPARQKSDFYHLARPDESDSQFEDQPLLGLVGRRGVGKTTLLHQFIHHRIEAGDDPERFLYLPFDADPLCNSNRTNSYGVQFGITETGFSVASGRPPTSS